MIGDIFAGLIMLLIIFVPVTVFIAWFIMSITSIILRIKYKEKPTAGQIVSLILSSIPVGFIIYLVVAFSMGMSFM